MSIIYLKSTLSKGHTFSIVTQLEAVTALVEELLVKVNFPHAGATNRLSIYMSEVIQDPNSIWLQQNGKPGAKYTKTGKPVKWQIDGTRDGINIRVIVEPDGKGAITAFPTNIPPNP
ncbi:MAG: hypothetical protein HC941_12195 [Microcoleus sp. SU_5_3]|nr:hypothetical protein [Microcoleus sp. SU_5_3]